MSQTGLSGNTSIDALLSTYQWGTQNGVASTITYSFPNALTSTWVNNYSADNEPNTWTGLDATGQQYFKQALSAWSEIANITFAQVVDNQNTVGDIRVAFTDVIAQLGYDGWAYNPGSSPANGDIWLSKNLTDFSPGSKGYYTFLHELGHALGLKHPFESDVDNTTTLPATQDNTQFSLMSYTPYEGAGFQYTTIDATSYSYAATKASSPMLYDIAAIQFLYGANMTTRAGDDVYTFSNSQAELKTIWDAGGTDSFDLSNQTLDMVINLNAGAFSSLGVKQITYEGALIAATENIAIAYNVTIENAIGGVGNDSLYGNDVSNTLSGGAGNDQIFGGSGNDLLDWDANARTGNDTLSGGLGDDQFVIDSLTDVIKEYFAEGIDTIWSQIGYSLAAIANVENLSLIGSAAVKGTGNGLKNTLQGNSAANTLNGGSGNDKLIGMDGNDKLIGGIGNDILNGGLGNDVLTGGKGKDIFQLTHALNAKNNIDRITDFVAVDDTLQLENSVFTSLVKTGKLAVGLLKAGVDMNKAADANDYLIYNSTDGKLYYDADGSGSTVQTQIALLGTGLVLTEADFVII
jgi:Ca2+-binding RTX toxin-like protein